MVYYVVMDLTLSEMIDIARRRRGLTFAEIAKRMESMPRPDGKERGHVSGGNIADIVKRGERLQVMTLMDLCEAMDCELEIKITPRTTKLDELNKNLERSC